MHESSCDLAGMKIQRVLMMRVSRAGTGGGKDAGFASLGGQVKAKGSVASVHPSVHNDTAAAILHTDAQHLGMPQSTNVNQEKFDLPALVDSPSKGWTLALLRHPIA